MPFKDKHGASGGGGPVTPPSQLECADYTITTGATGDAVYISGTSAVSKTDNAAIATSRAVGIVLADGSVATSGCGVLANFVTDDGTPVAGQPVYLAGTGNDAGAGVGKLTPLPPVASGSVVNEIGICEDASGWAAGKTALILIQPKAPMVIP